MATARERLIEDLLESAEIRREVTDEHLDAHIALQIKALRQQRNWTQSELARKADLGQTQISEFENVNHSAWTMLTLKRLARAFDLPLLMSFGSWGELVLGTARLSRAHLERPTFEEDPVFSEAREANAITGERLADLMRASGIGVKYVETPAADKTAGVSDTRPSSSRMAPTPAHHAVGDADTPVALAA